MPCFRTCLTCRSRSQAPLCHCTQRLIANQPEGTFGRLRYNLGILLARQPPRDLPSRGHFCLDLHVAMQLRPFHHPSRYDGALVVVVGVGGRTPPNLLIARTGQIVTSHLTKPTKAV